MKINLTDNGSINCHDITIENIAIAAKELAFEALFKNLPVHFYWMDKNGILLGCNQEVADALGFNSIKDIVGKHTSEIVTQKGWENCIKVIESGKTLTIEEVHTKTNGEKITFLSIKSPIIDDKDTITGLIGVSVNISERKQIEQELAAAKESTDKVNQGLEAMAASIAHELRTPLSAISASANGIRKCLPNLVKTYETASTANLNIPYIPKHLITNLQNSLQRINEETKLAHTIINMVLVKTKKQHHYQASFVTYSIVDCINSALSRYPFNKDEQQLIHWQPTVNFDFYGIELLTIHVFFNLIKNALYSIKTIQKGQIFIWLEKNEIFNKVFFKDTAKGIPPDIVPHIFDRFFTRSLGGTGTGLYFCKSTMEDFGGSISCTSIENKHTTFILKFPAKFS